MKLSTTDLLYCDFGSYMINFSLDAKNRIIYQSHLHSQYNFDPSQNAHSLDHFFQLLTKIATHFGFWATLETKVVNGCQYKYHMNTFGLSFERKLTFTNPISKGNDLRGTSYVLSA